ncbi:caspase family protein [Dongia sedimenti]|uniref:Caspase family protein n=1 Tax=Dongia sedimenti TaxID=3064282 RepID=A0ABU0YP39_9PROT|nr:caspase family protein [Rhodospirillaceae bacterium R-7]
MPHLSFSRRGVTALGALCAGLALMLGLLVARPASAEPRVALVIGNSAYKGDLPALPNPSNDAKLMARTLKSIGFDVVEAEDASQAEMKQKIQEFSDKLAAAGKEGTGLFFYAGHGLQVAGENYLIPVDAKIKSERDVDLVSVSATTVMKQMEFAESAVNIIILDACRNNPLGDGARSLSRGLAKIETAPRGSFIAYSTAPGSTAADGDGVNSPYTKALAETITQPGLSIADVFQEVRTKVLASTGNEQTPWDSSSLTGRFYFKAPEATQTASVTPPAAPATSAEEEALKTEKAYWDSVKDSGDADSINLYLAKYPNGYFVDLANAKLDELKGGSKVASAGTGDGNAISRDSVADPTQVQPQAAEVSFIAQSQTVYAKSGGQVRAAPNAGAKMLSKLQTNTEVTATGLSADGKWWRVALADGRTGYMHRTVVAEQPIQTASAAPAAPPAAQPAVAQTLGPDAFETAGAPQPAPAPVPSSEVGQALLSGVASQLGISIPQVPSAAPTQPQQPMAASFSFNPVNVTIKVREGAQIFDAPGGQPIFKLRQGGPLLATARSSDGRWYQVSLSNGAQGFVPRQSVMK